MALRTAFGRCIAVTILLTFCVFTGCNSDVQEETSSIPPKTTPTALPDKTDESPKEKGTQSPQTTPAVNPADAKVLPRNEAVQTTGEQPVEPEKSPIFIAPGVIEKIDKSLNSFAGVCVSINELAMDMDIARDEVAENLAELKKLCKENDLRLVLNYLPCFETTQAKFVVRSTGPWSWAFAVQKGAKDICDCVLLKMTGESPVFSVTKEGQRRFPETAMIPLGTLAWGIEDANGSRVGKEVSGQFIKPGRVTASVAFPSGDCPQFLDKMFDINLIASTGQLKFLSGHELYFQPVGKDAIRVPLFEYYQKKREEKEKKRGSAFDAKVHPSPIKDAIGMIVYMEIVHNQFEKSGITERNDVGFDLFIETANNGKLMLYTARPTQ